MDSLSAPKESIGPFAMATCVSLCFSVEEPSTEMLEVSDSGEVFVPKPEKSGHGATMFLQ